LNEPLWSDPGARVLACTIAGLRDGEEDLHLVLNMSDEDLRAPLPVRRGRRWHLALDTALDSPRDILRPEQQVGHEGEHYVCRSHSVAVLEAR
jgi:glycogen operon protein